MSHPNMRYDERGSGMLRRSCECSYCEIKIPGMKYEDGEIYSTAENLEKNPLYIRRWCPQGCSRTARGLDPVDGKCPQCRSILK